MPRPDRIVATILGCGSSGGVPRIGNDWGACDPHEPRNRRRRCSLLIEGWTDGVEQPTRILIDTGCDLREQLLDAAVDRVDAVFYTHEHADHTHGIDDLRVLALHNRRRVDVYFSAECGARLREAFGYCFSTPPSSGYPPILNAHEIADGESVQVEGPGGTLEISAFLQTHGDIDSFGYRLGGLAYSCDLSALPESSAAAVSGLDIWIIDALRRTPHPSHLSLPEALDLVSRHAPRQAVLTNLHIDLDYTQTDEETPDTVTPAFDGMQIDIGNGRILNR